MAVKTQSALPKAKPTKKALSAPQTASTPIFRNFWNNKKLVTLAIALVVLIAFYFLRGVFVAATVNGKPISRLQLIQELEKQNGKEALNALISKELIFQEAAKQKVEVSQKEIDEEVKKIEENVSKQGQNLDELLKAQNLKRDSFREQLKLEKTIQALVGKDIVITDKEVEDYINNNKDSFPQEATIAELKEPVKQQLKQQRMSEKFESWLSDLQKKAKIFYFINL